jgi:hypothetical protein
MQSFTNTNCKCYRLPVYCHHLVWCTSKNVTNQKMWQINLSILCVTLVPTSNKNDPCPWCWQSVKNTRSVNTPTHVEQKWSLCMMLRMCQKYTICEHANSNETYRSYVSCYDEAEMLSYDVPIKLVNFFWSILCFFLWENGDFFVKLCRTQHTLSF